MKMKVLSLAVIAALLTGCGGGGEGKSSSGSNIVKPKPQIELPLLKMANLKVSEPKEGTSTFNFKISLTKPAIKDVTFKYESFDVSASHRLLENQYINKHISDINRNEENLDYVRVVGSGTIKKGEQFFSIPFVVMADTVHERPESFALKITELSNAKFYKGHDQGEVVIADVDKEPVISIGDTKDTLIAEGNTINIPVSMSSPSARGVKLYFSLTGDAAIHKDYEILTSSPIIFGDNGDTSALIKIHVLKDFTLEDKESLKLELISATEATINRKANTKNITIASDKALNDTGVTTFFVERGVDELPNSNYQESYGQSSYGYNDADFGRDAEQPNNQDGWAGYQLDAIDSSGNIAGMDEVPRCVRDNVTGLLWERLGETTLLSSHVAGIDEALNEQRYGKTPEDKEQASQKVNAADEKLFNDGLNWQSKSYQYLWHDGNAKTNGGEPGELLSVATLKKVNGFKANNMCTFPSNIHENKLTIPTANVTACTAQAKAEYATHYNLCGAKSWRLPTISELINHHNYSAVVPTSIPNYPINKNESNNGVVDHFGNNVLLVNPVIKDGNIENQDVINLDPSVSNKQREALYLSSSTVANAPGSVWCMGALTGEVKMCKKKEAHSVILVSDDITND
ncbi:Lcl domain-containing protein [Photobacterium toruni]|uniref:Lcl domain-containing protein n=1 Tax=Photobacterium toruni TaxID=1935446 RepID=UPI002110242A|nr:DUF1566 domain-containing protein [Photobacterium toruni]